MIEDKVIEKDKPIHSTKLETIQINNHIKKWCDAIHEELHVGMVR